MSQIMYNYPAMLGHAGDMSGYAGTLQGLGADIASEQAALSNAWQGDTGMTYQVWQAQWNQAMESLVRANASLQAHLQRRILFADRAACFSGGKISSRSESADRNRGRRCGRFHHSESGFR